MVEFMGPILDPLLRVRVPGTAGSAAVRRFIHSFLKARTANWHIEMDAFKSSTPIGARSFTNIVATLDPFASRRLVLACHYDSKYFPKTYFVGATDAAVPCAMILDLVRKFDSALAASTSKPSARDLTLQVIFFDGEEAFKKWTSTDSLYGSRHLAAKMASRPHPLAALTGGGFNSQPSTDLQSIETFVLLDLLGAAKPNIYDYVSSTSHLYKELERIEHRLFSLGLLHGDGTSYFVGPSGPFDYIEDDHIPFLQRGVPALHLIASPFPAVWHTPTDTKEALDPKVIDNLNRIIRVFTAEYLHLSMT